MKKCVACKIELNISLFGKNKRLSDGLTQECRYCHNERSKRAKYKYRYGITLEEKEEILKKQKYKCAICKKDISKRSCVDHNHKTLKVRALLCDFCNTGIGMFKENITLLAKTIAYLNKWKK